MPPAACPPPPPLRWAWHDHPHHAVAETAARAWLGQALDLPAAAVPLLRDRHGRPRLQAPRAGFDTSWSHSGEGLLIALGEDVDVGIDLERLRPRPRAAELARRFFTAQESEWLAAQDPARRDLDFVRLWCAKEALLKAYGRGLAFGLHRLQFAERDGALALVACDRALGATGDWTVHEWSPRPGYHAALAWRPA